MFRWLKKLTGGARTSDAPPVSVVPAVKVDWLDEGPDRICAPLVFLKPANIDPFSTMFGIVRLARKEEVWPTLGGAPLSPLLQLNLTQAPHVPVAVRDLSLITVFISEGHSHSRAPTRIIDTQNPDPQATWALRSYISLDGLTIPRAPQNIRRITPLLGEWAAPRTEQQSEHDAPFERIAGGNDGSQSDELKLPMQQTKLGGWANPLCEDPWWANSGAGDTWDFVMQIENEPKAGWHGWSGSAAYIARSREHPHLWAIDVQVT